MSQRTPSFNKLGVLVITDLIALALILIIIKAFVIKINIS